MMEQRSGLLGSVREGMDVVGSDDEKLGEIAAVEGSSIVVKKGFFFPKDYYIPADAVTSVDDNTVYLNVSKDAALNEDWETPPAGAGVTGYGAPEANATSEIQAERMAGYTDTTTSDRVSGYTTTAAGDRDTGTTVDRTDEYSAPIAADQQRMESETMSHHHEDHRQPFEHELEGNLRDADLDDKVDVPLAEEELSARTRPVERGAVRVDKDVVEEQQTLDVPVTEERVHVQRRAVDRDVEPGDESFGDGEIEVPVRGEDVDVDRETRVREEVEISKEPVQRTERVTGTVRREEAHVEDETTRREAGNMPDNWQNR